MVHILRTIILGISSHGRTCHLLEFLDDFMDICAREEFGLEQLDHLLIELFYAVKW